MKKALQRQQEAREIILVCQTPRCGFERSVVVTGNKQHTKPCPRCHGTGWSVKQ